jgi:hypothetical protein
VRRTASSRSCSARRSSPATSPRSSRSTGRLADLLATVDVADAIDQQRIRLAVVELHEHIAKEEDGLFPASLTTLSGSDWDEAIAAWYVAHPGAEMMTD